MRCSDVVRCFAGGDDVHVEGSVEPIRDIETIDTELMLADLETVESSLDKVVRLAKSGDKDAIARADILRRVQGEPQRRQTGGELDFFEERKLLRPLGPITAKEALVRRQRRRVGPAWPGAVGYHSPANVPPRKAAAWFPVRGKLEANWRNWTPRDLAEMLSSMGLHEPALAALCARRIASLGRRVTSRPAPRSSGHGPSRSAHPPRMRPG